MYYFFVVLCLCNMTIVAVIPNEKESTILSYEYKNFGGGNYTFRYTTSNGIERNETGQLMNTGKGNEYIAVQGFYSYIDPDGKLKSFVYSADDTGYHVNVLDSAEVGEEHPSFEISKFAIAEAISGQVLSSLLGR